MHPKFRISADPNVAKQTIPAFLQRKQFRGAEVDGSDLKYIYLPPTEQIRQAQILQIAGSMKDPKSIILKVPNEHAEYGSQEYHWETISSFQMGILIEQVRARVGQRLLPSYRVSASVFSGEVLGWSVTVNCYSVTEAPAGLTGSYVNIIGPTHISSNGTLAEQHQFAARVLEMEESSLKLIPDTFAGLLRNLTSDYPWVRTVRPRDFVFFAHTNDHALLDPKLVERFERTRLSPPDRSDREKLFQLYTGKHLLADDVDLAVLTERSDGITSGALIQTIVSDAADLARQRHSAKLQAIRDRASEESELQAVSSAITLADFEKAITMAFADFDEALVPVRR